MRAKEEEKHSTVDHTQNSDEKARPAILIHFLKLNHDGSDSYRRKGKIERLARAVTTDINSSQ